MADEDTGIIQGTINTIGNYIASLVETIGNYIAGFFRPIVETLNDWMASIFSSLRAVANTIRDQIADVWSSISDFVDTTVQRIVNFVDDIIGPLLDSIRETVTSAIEAIRTVVDDVVNYIGDIVQAAYDYLADAFNALKESFLAVVGDIRDWIAEAFQSVVDTLGAIATDVRQYFLGLWEEIKGAVQSVMDSAMQVVDAVKAAVEEFVGSVVNVVGETLRDLLDTIADLPDVLADGINRLIENSKEFIGTPLAGLPSDLWDYVRDLINGAAEGDAAQLEQANRLALTGERLVATNRAEWSEFFQSVTQGSPVMRWIINLLIAFVATWHVAGGMGTASAQIILQEHALTTPFNLMPVGDTVSAYHFGLISREDAILNIRKQGYASDVAASLIETGETLPPEMELVNWYLREMIDGETLRTELKKRGWGDANIARLEKAAFFIPPAQDLIAMAVREAFSPEVAAAFGQYEDFPQEFATWAARQGISEEWAQRYWAAHWALPSVQMGFEMLHRRIINEEQLNLLLRAQDVMPFWRDKLVSISYAPLTRVDVRRMHKMGVLNDEEVRNAYRDIGYDEVNSQRMLDFTIEYNKGGAADDEGDLSTLTRSNIIAFYRDGVIDRGTAKELLQLADYSEAAAELYLTAADLDEQREVRQAQIDLIISRAKAGLLTTEEAQGELNALGLETAESLKAQAKLINALQQRPKLPSRSDLDKFLLEGIINEAVYLNVMERGGYAANWAQAYLQLAKRGSGGDTV